MPPPSFSEGGADPSCSLNAGWDTVSTNLASVAVTMTRIDDPELPPLVCGDIDYTMLPRVQAQFVLDTNARGAWRRLLRNTDGFVDLDLLGEEQLFAGLVYVSTVDAQTAVAFGDIHDLLGFALHVGPGESVGSALPAYDWDDKTAIAAQYWGRIQPPTDFTFVARDTGYNVGPWVTISWLPGHGGGGQYRTRIERDGASLFTTTDNTAKDGGVTAGATHSYRGGTRGASHPATSLTSCSPCPRGCGPRPPRSRCRRR